MPGIKLGVYAAYFRHYPRHKAAILPFSHLFEVSYGEHWLKFNADVGAFLLKPEQEISSLFGFQSDLLLIYSPFQQIQARALQAATAFAQRDDIRLRAERLCILLLSEDPGTEAWLKKYLASNPESHIFIPFATSDFAHPAIPNNVILDRLTRYLHTVDFFDDTLPLRRDAFFFGRTQILMDFLTGLRGQVNRGLFGLRKVGKTSLLLKVEREFKRAGLGRPLFINCADPAISECRANALLDKLSDQIAQLSSIPRKGFVGLPHASERFREATRRACKEGSICLLFDEIEHISFLSINNKHWENDFLPFWQAIRAAQQAVPQLSVVVCGVNASVCEKPHVSGSPNPLFGIVKPVYLQDFSETDTYDMVSHIGAPMGLVFEPAALKQLYSEYGGHPLLTRLACSYIHKTLEVQKQARPFTITVDDVRRLRDARDRQIQFYCEYITADIKEFYPTEFELLERVACREIVDWFDYFGEEDVVRHLYDYGLLRKQPVPAITIDVLGEHLRWQRAREKRRLLSRDPIPVETRDKWYTDRINLLLTELRKLGAFALGNQALRRLLPKEPFSKQEMLFGCKLPGNRDDFLVIMNRLYQVLIESLHLSRAQFFQELPVILPLYQKALHRVRVYRNWEHHLRLESAVERQLAQFLEADLEGKPPERVPDVYFTLVQITLDELALAVVSENALRT